MLDEAHERSLQTDILMGLLKKIQRRRSDLRFVHYRVVNTYTHIIGFSQAFPRSQHPSRSCNGLLPALLDCVLIVSDAPTG
jgi:hypothetical protein